MKKSFDVADSFGLAEREPTVDLLGNTDVIGVSEVVRVEPNELCLRASDDLAERVAGFHHRTGSFLDLRSHHDSRYGCAKLSLRNALLLILDFDSMKVRSQSRLARHPTIIAKLSFGEVALTLPQRGLRLSQFYAIVAIVELRERLAGFDGVALAHENALDDSALDRTDDPALGR